MSTALRSWTRAVALVASLCLLAPLATSATVPPAPGPGTPPIKHVFIIVLENQAYDNTFGAMLPVPYLSQTVAAHGALLQNYYGTSHFSLGNYLTMISGQAVTTANQDDCGVSDIPHTGSLYSDILVQHVGPFDQVQGTGCVYPAAVKTIADQLSAAGDTWKGYMEDMGNDPTREAAVCGQPVGGIGTPDDTQAAQVPAAGIGSGKRPIEDQYAAKHNPFVYFRSLLDSGACYQHVVPLTVNTLPEDLRAVATTPNYAFITPNLCDDGHDVPCKELNAPKSQQAENAFLARWIPMIVRSPAFQQDGLLVVTFDEASPASTSALGANTALYDTSSCCNEPSGLNTKTPGMGPIERYLVEKNLIHPIGDDSGGGRTGAVLVSPFIAPGTVSVAGYNHYSLLHAVEDYFGLPYLGYAGFPGTTGFGNDVFGATPQRYTIAL